MTGRVARRGAPVLDAAPFAREVTFQVKVSGRLDGAGLRPADSTAIGQSRCRPPPAFTPFVRPPFVRLKRQAFP